MNDLYDVLDRATDRVATPGLAGGALAEARRRRRRARGYGAALVAAAAVIALLVSLRVVDGRDGEVQPMPAPPAPITLPLPRVLAPPAYDDVDRLAESPLTAAVLTVERPGGVLLLGVDGTWRRVTCDNGTLSGDGTRMYVAETDGSTQVWDVTTGTWTRSRSVAVPEAPGRVLATTADGTEVVLDAGPRRTVRVVVRRPGADVGEVVMRGPGVLSDAVSFATGLF